MARVANKRRFCACSARIRRWRSVRLTAAVLLLLTGSFYLAACAQPVITDPLDERSTKEVASDLAIRETLNRLIFKQNIRLYQTVSIAVIEGRVLLTGIVPSADDAGLARRLAERAAGVREVIDEIQVGDESGFLDIADDASISSQLSAALVADTAIVWNNYRVGAVGGTVYLLGIAQDEAELSQVAEHARKIDGVKDVVSHVVLKDDPRRPAPRQ